MKQFYFKISLITSLALTTYSEAQTYIIDSVGATCSANNASDIDHGYVCASPGTTVELGTFTDTATGAGGVTLASMDLKIYSACDGDYTVLLNGEPLGVTGTTSGVGCNCSAIASDSDITNNLSISLTTDIINSYVIGGVNTLSVNAVSIGLVNTMLCFYGAEVTVTLNNPALSTEDVELNSVKVSPNPTSDYITVTGLKDTGNYKMYDVLGAEVHKGTITDKGEIEVKSFSNGVYFLKFDNEYTVRFIKKN